MTQRWNVKKIGSIHIASNEAMAHREMENGGSKGYGKGNEEAESTIPAVIHQKSSCSRPFQFDNKASVLQRTAHQ